MSDFAEDEYINILDTSKTFQLKIPSGISIDLNYNSLSKNEKLELDKNSIDEFNGEFDPEDHQHKTCFGIFHNKDAIGFCEIELNAYLDEEDETTTSLYLENIYITPQFRNKKIGFTTACVLAELVADSISNYIKSKKTPTHKLTILFVSTALTREGEQFIDTMINFALNPTHMTKLIDDNTEINFEYDISD